MSDNLIHYPTAMHVLNLKIMVILQTMMKNPNLHILKTGAYHCTAVSSLN